VTDRSRHLSFTKYAGVRLFRGSHGRFFARVPVKYVSAIIRASRFDLEHQRLFDEGAGIGDRGSCWR
jgi:hypothetical protein